MFKSFIFQERCINAGTLTVNFEKVPVDYKLKHNDLLANIVHRYIICLDLRQYLVSIQFKSNLMQSIKSLVVGLVP